MYMYVLLDNILTLQQQYHLASWYITTSPGIPENYNHVLVGSGLLMSVVSM